jgi:purine nucleoside permease
MAQVPVRIAVKSAATADGFTDPSKARQDSVKDVTNRLKDSKVVQLVPEGEAIAVLEVLDRQTNREVNFWGTQNKSSLVVRLTAGDYSTEFVGESGSSGILKNYKGAASSIVKQLEAWVKANHDRLVSR